jgi:lipopolysaccharide/colanic/teichoic acid biosynthesis glycosyltransferase
VEGFVLKRALDIFLAGTMLFLTLPLLTLAAIAIKLDSHGPVLFCQARMGRGFMRFRILKLRTMHIEMPGSPFTLGRDPRITRVGRWLRWLKVDELPQLLNVLSGAMSLVGPRPVVPELALESRAAYSRLLEVRPGLTDPASMKYCRENELLALLADPLSHFKMVMIPDKLRISEAYLERASVWTDLGVMVRTVLVLVPVSWQPRLVRTWPFEPVKAPEIKFP